MPTDSAPQAGSATSDPAYAAMLERIFASAMANMAALERDRDRESTPPFEGWDSWATPEAAPEPAAGRQEAASAAAGATDGPLVHIDPERLKQELARPRPPPDPRKAQMHTHAIDIACFNSRQAPQVEHLHMSWRSFCKWLADPPKAATKAALPWLKMGAFTGTRNPEGSSMRYDAGVCKITGIELDYDKGDMTFDAAVKALSEAGIEALVVTSPSYTPECPKLRIFAPVLWSMGPPITGVYRGQYGGPGAGTRPGTTDETRAWRKELVLKIQAVLPGTIDPASYILSQAYLYGHVEGHEYRVQHVKGAPIDCRTDLQPAQPIRPGKAPEAGQKAPKPTADRVEGDKDALDISAAFAAILTGDNFHASTRDLAASMAARGIPAGVALGLLQGAMQGSRAAGDPERWASRYNDLPGLVESGMAKFAKINGAEHLREAFAAIREQRGGEQGAAGEAAGAPGPTTAADTPAGGSRAEEILTAAANDHKLTPKAAATLAQAFDAMRRQPPPSVEALLHVPPTDFYVADLIVSHLAGVLVSIGGLGKTTLLLQLAIATATGGVWLGCEVKQGAFALVSLDDPKEDLQAALALLLQHEDLNNAQLELVRTNVHLFSLRGIDGQLSLAKVNEEGYAEPTLLPLAIELALRDIPDLRCVVLDTLRQFAGGSTTDDRVMTIATKAVTRLADARRCAAIVCHHTTKAGAREGLIDQYSGSGSGSIADNLRFVLVLSKVESLAEIEKEIKIEPGQAVGLRTKGTQLLRLTDTRGSILRPPIEDTFIARQGFSMRAIGGEPKTPEEKTAEGDAAIIQAVRSGATSVEAIRVVVARGKGAVTKDVTRLIDQHKLARGTGGRGVQLTAESPVASGV